jgi:hypothetical protein
MAAATSTSWLHSFRFRLSPESVEHCLASVLGGTSKNFAAIQLEDQIFRFSVSSKQVGFLVLRLESFACDSFKLAFHLYNDSGLFAARVFSKSDSGPPPSPWIEVNRKNKNGSSYADVVRSNQPTLTGANTTPIGRQTTDSRRANGVINFSNKGFKSLSSSGIHPKQRISVFNRISFPRRSVFDRLNLGGKSLNRSFQISNQKSKGPTGSRPNTVAGKDGQCSRYLSPNHLRSACQFKIKCWNCKQEGHVFKSCFSFTAPRAPVVIHGQDFTGRFSSFPAADLWKSVDTSKWFKQPIPMTSGPEHGGPSLFHNTQEFAATAQPLSREPAPSPSSHAPQTKKTPEWRASITVHPHKPHTN